MTKGPTMIRCAVYTRKSSDEGLDQAFNSLDAQHEACAAYVASQKHEGWKLLPARFDDGGISGGTLDRPALQRLLAEIDAGRVNMVVVYKIDRLTRSLADFARLLERLEARNCSFVSVTQAFNTSTSMGRLTLNVLLSFAQFEREVTAERIRDKIAASKKKGLWMGGLAPLGYDRHPDPLRRELVVKADEAVLVRRIFGFRRDGLDLGEIEARCAAEGICSKRHHFASGAERGGGRLTRGQIHYILTNPVYRGLIRHKDACYAGTHPAIIDDEFWRVVQDELQKAARKPRGTAGLSPRPVQAKIESDRNRPASEHVAPLKGKIRDDTGDLLTPTHTQRHDRRYRYYISNRLLSGGADRTAWRIPSRSIESAVRAAVTAHLVDAARSHRLLAAPDAARSLELAARVEDRMVRPESEMAIETLALVQSITIAPGNLDIALDPAVVSHALDLAGGEISEAALRFNCKSRVRRRGVETKIVAGQIRPFPDQTLRRTLALAHRWVGDLRSGKGLTEIAAEGGHADSYLRTRAPFAFLSPKIQAAILNGTHPPDLTAERLARTPIPLDWAEQEAQFGFA
ncbi:recombinase family protein [Defluviimonas sp. WL0024]|uniref:Recombinase family protein n=1 Tax=Albidovulum salinarum TaxID=2984153 RepID=A0ABT2WYG2_9RHOB|nr:recombinase family protein [Defluviimonas sp. WL0024]MCU9846722.1 recombinase family protein [Defluviimonas sp. WL0024]